MRSLWRRHVKSQRHVKVLADAVDVENKADEAEKLTAQVSTMTGEQLAALKAAIEVKEKQQQN